jgi:hypothetical protein
MPRWDDYPCPSYDRTGISKNMGTPLSTASSLVTAPALREAAIFTPGQLHDYHPATRTVEDRVHFAGEHTSLKPAWIEGSLESAARSALEVHQR